MPATDTTWVYEGYGHFHPYPSDHVKAVTYRQALDGMLPLARENRQKQFQAWQAKRQRMLRLRETLPYAMEAFQEPVVDLPAILSETTRDYVLYGDGRTPDPQPAFVALKDIIPTQREVNRALVDWYQRSGYTYDPAGKPPFAVRFYGDRHVYLINGHHRYARNLRLARGTHLMMYLHVDAIDVSFEEACGKLEPFPVDVVQLFEVLLGDVA